LPINFKAKNKKTIALKFLNGKVSYDNFKKYNSGKIKGQGIATFQSLSGLERMGEGGV